MPGGGGTDMGAEGVRGGGGTDLAAGSAPGGGGGGTEVVGGTVRPGGRMGPPLELRFGGGGGTDAALAVARVGGGTEGLAGPLSGFIGDGSSRTVESSSSGMT